MSNKKLKKEDLNKLGLLFFDFIIRSSLSKKGLSIYKQLKNSKEITDDEKYEILSYETFTVLTALQIKLDDHDLDKVSTLTTELLFASLTNYNLNLNKFSEILINRCENYNKILATNDDRRVILLAGYFASKFYNRDIQESDAMFISSISDMFAKTIEILKKEIDNTIKQ